MNRKTKRTVWMVLAVIVVTAALLAVYYFTSVVNELQDLNKEGENSPFYNVEKVDQEITPDPPKWEGKEPVNILLMGVDARGLTEGEIPRSDTMLVASLNPVSKKYRFFLSCAIHIQTSLDTEEIELIRQLPMVLM